MTSTPLPACPRAGCSGEILDDGFCGECGRKPPKPKAAATPSASPSATSAGGTGPGGARPAAPSPAVSGSWVPGQGAPGTSASGPNGPASTSAPATTSSPASTRLSTSGTVRSSERGRLGGPVSLPVIPARNPEDAVLTDPSVPERRRYCGNGNCGEPVGRARRGKPGRATGFCAKCGTRFAFTPKLGRGDVVHDKYEIRGCLAHGGLGWIYLAYDSVLHRYVVLKGLLDTGDADAVAQAVAEREFMAQVAHARIVKIHDYVRHGGDGYIVMEYIGGRSLSSLYAERLEDGGGPLPLPQALTYMIEILPALGHLHASGLVYCDLKPANVMHTEEQLTLIDLGAVRRLDDRSGGSWGTPGYWAPEVARRDDPANPTVASDLYTVGRTLAALTFQVRGFPRDYPGLPSARQAPILAEHESFHRLLRRATHPDPAARFASAEDMAEQLRGVRREALAVAGARPDPELSRLFSPERHRFGTDVVGGTTGGPGVTGIVPLQPAAVASSLPVHQTDPDDPAAGLLSTSTTTDPETLLRQIPDTFKPQLTPELNLRVGRLLLDAGDLGPAEMYLSAGERAFGLSWEIRWYRGLARLAAGDTDEAWREFDAVYDLLPGELAPKLALAATAECRGEQDRARGYYERVWRTDTSYVSAAFGLARQQVSRGDHAGAVAVLDEVPETFSAYTDAQVAAVRVMLHRPPEHLAAGDLVVAGDRLQRLASRLPETEARRLTIALFGKALDWLRAGRPGPPGASGGTGDRWLLGVELSERAARFRLEQEFRALARHAPEPDRVDLVDAANRVRPRTWW